MSGSALYPGGGKWFRASTIVLEIKPRHRKRGSDDHQRSRFPSHKYAYSFNARKRSDLFTNPSKDPKPTRTATVCPILRVSRSLGVPLPRVPSRLARGTLASWNPTPHFRLAYPNEHPFCAVISDISHVLSVLLGFPSQAFVISDKYTYPCSHL